MHTSGNPIALLLLIAKRRTIDFLKSYARKHGSSIEAIEEEAEAQDRGTGIEALTNSETPHDELSQKERRALVNLVLDLIGKKCRLLLVGAYVDDRSYRELANELSASEDDVDNWIRDCKKRWKERYKQLIDIDYTAEEEAFAL